MKCLFFVFIIVAIIGCNQSKNRTPIKEKIHINMEYILDSLDLQYYPSFSDPIGACVNFKMQTIRVYPLSEEYYRKKEIIKEQIVKVDLGSLITIDSIVRNITCEEFEYPFKYYAIDGMHLDSQFYFSDGSIFSNSPGNDPKIIFNNLKITVFEIMKKNIQEENHQKIFKEINEYLY